MTPLSIALLITIPEIALGTWIYMRIRRYPSSSKLRAGGLWALFAMVLALPPTGLLLSHYFEWADLHRLILKVVPTCAEWILFKFGMFGGGYLLAFGCLLLAHTARRRAKVILCVVAWLLIIWQSWWLYALMWMASLGHDHYPEQRKRFETVAISGIVAALAVSGCWTYMLFRKRGPTLALDAAAE